MLKRVVCSLQILQRFGPELWIVGESQARLRCDPCLLKLSGSARNLAVVSRLLRRMRRAVRDFSFVAKREQPLRCACSVILIATVRNREISIDCFLGSSKLLERIRAQEIHFCGIGPAGNARATQIGKL